MEYCDICGAPIEGRPYVIKLDNAVLHVCKRCAALYGANVVEERQEQPRRISPQPKRPPPPRQESRYEIIEEYAEVIKSARESMGLTREALASYLGVKESVLRRIESGQLMPDIQLAKKLEKALGVKLLVPARQAEEPSSSGGPRRGLTLGDVAELRDEE